MGAGHIPIIKKKARKRGCRIVFEDEAGFRQDPTLHKTWSRKGYQPQVEQLKKRSGIKVLGCIDIEEMEFKYTFEKTLEARSYIAFLETTVTQFFEKDRPILYIQDNASYHKDGDVWYWFRENRKWIEVYNLPPYCPELNAVERLWKFTRSETTHNRYFDSVGDLEVNLVGTFEKMNKNPVLMKNKVSSFL